MLTGPQVLADMPSAYRQMNEGASFASALLRVLTAGAEAGGGGLGTGSAALRVHSEQGFAELDLRVNWSSDPIASLAELLDPATAGPYAYFFAGEPRRRR